MTGYYYLAEGRSRAVGPFASAALAADAALECGDATAEEHASLTLAMDRAPRRDRVALDRKSVRSVDEKTGHMRVERTPISKANACPYRGDEIPGGEELGLDPDRVYMLLRDPEELERAASTFDGKPLMLKHIPVSADDHPREVVVGAVGDGTRFDAPLLTAPLTVWDGEAIDLIESGRQKELSCAYHYRADMTPGTYEGQPYDGVMRDIVGNHVALVEEGRAGPDVVVGDSKINLKETYMKTRASALSAAGAVAHGALMTYLRPRLAADAKVDLRPALKGVTAKTFGAHKKRIAADVQRLTDGKLAADAEIADVVELLDHLEKDMKEGGVDAIEANGGPAMMPPAGGGDAGGEEAPDPKREFLKGKLSAEDMKSYDELPDDGMTAGDEEDEEARKKKEKEEAAAKDRAAKDAEPKITKAGMDAAIAAAERRVRDNLRAVADAQEVVRPYVGRIAVACDSAPDVYKAALDVLKVDVAGVDPSAFRAVLLAQPAPGQTQRPRVAVAADAAPSGYSFGEMFPGAQPTAHA